MVVLTPHSYECYNLIELVLLDQSDIISELQNEVSFVYNTEIIRLKKFPIPVSDILTTYFVSIKTAKLVFLSPRVKNRK